MLLYFDVGYETPKNKETTKIQKAHIERRIYEL